MWVPACLVYIAAGLAMFAGWLRESERRVLKRESRSREARAAGTGVESVESREVETIAAA